MALNQATREAIWASQLLDELGYPQRSVTIYSDSESAISLSKNAVIGPKSKHIRRQEHFIRDCLKDEDISVKYVNTDRQIADMLTKALQLEKLSRCRSGMGIENVATFSKGCQSWNIAS